MGAQFIDRGEPHHALGHLRLDRTVGIERIGHAIDHARFEHGYRRLTLMARGRRIAVCCRYGRPWFGNSWLSNSWLSNSWLGKPRLAKRWLGKGRRGTGAAPWWWRRQFGGPWALGL